jgi:hypothetical protein
MNSQTTTIDHSANSNVRIIWTLVAKDLVDGFKNKTILTTILTVAFLMVFYRVMPFLYDANDAQTLAVFGAADSPLVIALEDDPGTNLRELSSLASLERFLGRRVEATLGIVLPGDLDQMLVSEPVIEVAGLVDHWVSPSVLDELKHNTERKLEELAGKPIYINVVQDRVLTQINSSGAFTLSLGMVVLISMFGLSVTPLLMWEEKRTKTLNALLVSPASGGQIVISKGLTSLVYCLTGGALALAFNGMLIIQWGVVALALLSGSLFTIALGLLLGVMLETKQQITTVTFVLYQPLLLPVIAGIFEDLLPAGVLRALNLIPTVALGNVFRHTLMEQIAFTQFVPQLGYIVGIGGLLLVMVSRRLRRDDLA